jgi:hypothetical protein
MPYQSTIQKVKDALTEASGTLDQYFDLSAEMRAHKPTSDDWSINEILEHVTLTSHFLMMVIRQGRDKALKRAKTQAINEEESDLTPIEHIGHPDAFPWIRPEHMEPTGTKSPEEVRHLMRQQFQECLEILRQMPNGEGSLHQVRMSVQELGKLDMYGWLFFLSQHAKRHSIEIERLRASYQKQDK